MYKVISIEQAEQLDNAIYVDIRSPSEYRQGCIPEAINIPLFTDEERCRIGTTYKQVSVDDAKQMGIGFVAPRLEEMVSRFSELYRMGRTVIVYCWRGGMRSRSVVGLLSSLAIPVFQLSGGYKSYRRYVLGALKNFEIGPEIVVICGSTGVGKTTLLQYLSKKGIPVIDLEKLANHRGSVFGQVGLESSQSAQNFDALLLKKLISYNKQRYVVVECESKRVGNVYLPDVLCSSMRSGKRILAYADIDTRVSRLMSEYTDKFQKNGEEIIACLQSLTKRLGKSKTNKLIEDYSQGRIKEVILVLLTEYYDLLYGYEKLTPESFDLAVSTEDFGMATSQIIEFLERL